MSSAAIDDFLSGSNFIVKFISAYVRKDELKIFWKIIRTIL